MTSEKKPHRRMTVGFKNKPRVVHWARYRLVTPQESIIWGGSKYWVPACNDKFTQYGLVIPAKGQPKYRVTCPACVKKWGEGV